MSHVIDVVRVWSKHENEHDDHDGDEDQLTFEETTDNVKAFPVYDYVADDCADDTVEAGGGAGFYDGL